MTQLGLYLLTRRDSVDYEENAAVVVAAESAMDARELAGECHGGEAATVWHSMLVTTCTRIGIAVPEVTRGALLVENRGA